ncbi:PAAR domain-containing protein [Nannocystis punicea]|uniref:PAAR domain-containing protein n=1 Tax=Nannocystis punicea TaxID=2995304 RepID=A0ABY7GXP6_9BACT|nr:PAAR domain-containing protein [Nannocystis poenicansa]WAS91655.1 PAAR domain-containing protein [Nannocystis poenicansa]
MAAPAARHGDIIKHESKMLGFFAGAVAGALFGIIVLGTGGLALAAVVAVGAGVGYLAGAAWDAIADSPGVETGAVGLDETNVIINGKVAAAVVGKSQCYFPVVYSHGEKVISEGSSTVFFRCRPAARQGDALICDGKISSGSPDVIIGGGTVRIAGSKKTNFDYFLDYASLYLTVALGGASLATLAVSATAVGISELISVNAGLSRWVNFAAVNVVNSAGSLFNTFGIDNRLARAHNTTLLAAQRAEIQNAMYQRYVRGKAALGRPYQMQSEWARNNRVQWALDRRVAKAGAPKGMQALTGWKGASFQVGLPIAVDFARNWRDQERESRVPENPLAVSCDDTSWLEPA